MDDLVARYGLEPLPAMVFPADNRPDARRIELGRLLFFDPILSGEKDVACATCHHPSLGMADGRAQSVGVRGVGIGAARVSTDPQVPLQARNSPTVVNVGFNRFFSQDTDDGFMFWDGRKRGLETLATVPLRQFSEMRGGAYTVETALDSVVVRLRSIVEYQALFEAAFPDAPAGEAVDSLTLSQALAQFLRSLVGDRSPYDRFVAGDKRALTVAQKRGLVVFHEKGGCAACHAGPMFSDFNFHVVGARQQGPGFPSTPHEDFGRWNIAMRSESDRWKFRTPSLRNVAVTGPYTHAGAYATLGDVVEFMAGGGGDHPDIPPERVTLKPRDLSTREIADLVAFLASLTDVPPVEIPTVFPGAVTPPEPRSISR